MDRQRRTLAALAALSPVFKWSPMMAAESPTALTANTDRLLITDFTGDEVYYLQDSAWRGFTDRVMGGISDAAFGTDVVAGKRCARMSGDVTRESNGGFIQLSMSFGDYRGTLDASAYQGIELLVHGNDENYNLHVRTNDCRWYEQSYRMTFYAKPEWQTVRAAWSDFEPNGLSAPLDTAAINRIAVLGWMREFHADIGLAKVWLYS